MSPEAYQALQEKPEAFSGYSKLTGWRAFVLFVRLRIATLLPFIWSTPQKAASDAPIIQLPADLKMDNSYKSSHELMHDSGVSLESQSDSPTYTASLDSITKSKVTSAFPKDIDLDTDEVKANTPLATI